MIVKHRVPISEVVEELGAISACVGLTEEEVVSLLLCSGLTVVDILDYIEAVTSNRVN
jgi:hypothetical protein